MLVLFIIVIEPSRFLDVFGAIKPSIVAGRLVKLEIMGVNVNFQMAESKFLKMSLLLPRGLFLQPSHPS